MKRKTVFVVALLMAVAAVAVYRKPKASGPTIPEDQAIFVKKGNPEMNAAKARARAETDAFLAKVRSGEAQYFSVKIPVEDGALLEYFWLKDVAYADGVFTGKIDNDPEQVHVVKLGDSVTVKKEGIADWLYMQDGKMHGNYTLRVHLKKMSPEEADHWKKVLAD